MASAWALTVTAGHAVELRSGLSCCVTPVMRLHACVTNAKRHASQFSSIFLAKNCGYLFLWFVYIIIFMVYLYRSNLLVRYAVARGGLSPD